MDASNRIQTDQGPTGTRELSGKDISAKHHVIQQYDFLLSTDIQDRGQVLFELQLTPELTGPTQALAKEYEFWTIQNLEIELTATSPLGTSSGAIQVCHVTDPENCNWATAAPFGSNVDKAVRTNNSVLQRPREGKPYRIDTFNDKYTSGYGPADRWTSHGGVFAIQRASPDAGDSVEYAVTVTFDAIFTRPTITSTEGQALTQTYTAVSGKHWRIFAGANTVPAAVYLRRSCVTRFVGRTAAELLPAGAKLCVRPIGVASEDGTMLVDLKYQNQQLDTAVLKSLGLVDLYSYC